MVYLVNVKFVHVIEPVVVSETFQQIKFFCGDSFHFLLIKTNGIILVNGTGFRHTSVQVTAVQNKDAASGNGVYLVADIEIFAFGHDEQYFHLS